MDNYNDKRLEEKMAIENDKSINRHLKRSEYNEGD